MADSSASEAAEPSTQVEAAEKSEPVDSSSTTNITQAQQQLKSAPFTPQKGGF